MHQVSTLHFSIATYWFGHNAKLWRIVREPVVTDGIVISVFLPPFTSAMKSSPTCRPV